MVCTSELESYISKSIATGRSARTAEVLSEVLDTVWAWG